jgi:hypothetical protein
MKKVGGQRSAVSGQRLVVGDLGNIFLLGRVFF